MYFKSAFIFLISSLVSQAQFSMSGLGASGIGLTLGVPTLQTTQDYVIVVGQSLSRGGNNNSQFSISTAQPFNNQMWAQGVLTPQAASDALAGFVPLTESNSVETICSGFASQLHTLVGNSSRDCIIGTWGLDGQCYSNICKGGTGGITNAYFKSMVAVSNAVGRAPHLRVPAILSVHGECNASDVYYSWDINNWHDNYTNDILQETGQPDTIPMFHSQVQAANMNMLFGCQTNSENSIMVCSKYAFDYDTGGTHLMNYSYLTLGEYYAKAVYEKVVLGQDWRCLQPATISTTSNVITIGVTGNVGNIQWDTNFVSSCPTNWTAPLHYDPYGYGFIYYDDSANAPYITNIAIIDPAKAIIQISLSWVSTNNGLKLIEYGNGAQTNGTTATGRFTGLRGCLRDSDTTVGRNGTNLWNWCVLFTETQNWTNIFQ